MLVQQKNLKRLIWGTFIAAVILLLMPTTTSGLSMPEPSGSDLSRQEQRACYDDYNDDTYNLDRADGRQKLKDFKADKCYSGKGGTCNYVVPTAEAVARGASNKALISCTNPDGTTGGGGGPTTADIEDLSDPALAEGGCTGDNVTSSDERKNKLCTFIDGYINPFIKLLSALVGIVAIIFIIFGAIQVSTSAGDPQKSANGKNHIRNALIGLVAYVVLFAFLNWLIPGGIS